MNSTTNNRVVASLLSRSRSWSRSLVRVRPRLRYLFWTIAAAVFVLSLPGCGAGEAAGEAGLSEQPAVVLPSERELAERESAVYAHADAGFSGSFPGLGAVRNGLGEGQVLWNETSTPESMVVKNGVLYLVSSEPALMAVEIESRQLLWKHPFEAPVLAPPVVGEDEIWTATVDGVVQRISTSDGELMAEYQLGAAVYRAPLLLGQELLVAGESGLVEQVPATYHGTRTRFRSTDEPQSFLADHIFVVSISAHGQIQAFRRDALRGESPDSGMSELEYGPDLPRSATLRDGVLYVGGTGLAVYDLNSSETVSGAQPLGRVEELGSVHQILMSEYGPLVLDLYGYLHLLDSETLDARFSRQVRGEPTTAAVVDSVVYVGTDSGRLYAVDLPHGRVLWEAAAGNSPVRALFPRNEGIVVAYAAEGVLNFFAAGAGSGAGAAGQPPHEAEAAKLPATVGLGVHTALINDQGIQTRFAPEQTGTYEIRAAGRDGEELIIILLDEQGREMARNVGYRVEPRLAAELNAGTVYGIRLEPVMRGLGSVELQLEISRR